MNARLIAVGTVLCLLPTLTLAGPITDCYADAASDNPGLSMTVTTAGGSFTTSSVGVFMNRVARFHANPTIAVSTNTAGKDAVRQAMQCIWDEDRLTLSSLWLNENVTALSIVTPTAQRVSSSGSVIATLGFDGRSTMCTGGPSLELTGDGDEASMPAAKLGTHDLRVTVGVSGILLPICANLNMSCTFCRGECQPDGSTTCFCDTGDGNCQEIGGTGTISTGPLIVLSP